MNKDKLAHAVVVGGGHAGVEAAWVLHRLGVPTTLVTLSKGTIGRMSCNPAIGGLAKGHLVKEVDALGGLMGVVADRTAIQYRTLNERKGAAVRGTRVQSDRLAYERAVQSFILNAPNLRVLESEAVSVLSKHGRIVGVGLKDGSELPCGALVVCTGTFLGGLLHSGQGRREGGRANEPASSGLTESFKRLGISVRRFKTGTPARLLRSSIVVDKLERQDGDCSVLPFSFRHKEVTRRQIACFKACTNESTHAIIRENLHLSALYGGRIAGIGPRYCPSIEDKVVKFPERDRHTVFWSQKGLNPKWCIQTAYPPLFPQRYRRNF